MLEMNPEIREQWCKALRSGEYTQGRNALRIRNEDGTYSYCCLGVLTDLYVKAGNPQTYGDNFHVWEDNTLPDPVMKWAGIDVDNPRLWLGDEPTYETRASVWNDDRKADFREIADMIDGGQQD